MNPALLIILVLVGMVLVLPFAFTLFMCYCDWCMVVIERIFGNEP